MKEETFALLIIIFSGVVTERFKAKRLPNQTTTSPIALWDTMNCLLALKNREINTVQCSDNLQFRHHPHKDSLLLQAFRFQFLILNDYLMLPVHEPNSFSRSIYKYLSIVPCSTDQKLPDGRYCDQPATRCWYLQLQYFFHMKPDTQLLPLQTKRISPFSTYYNKFLLSQQTYCQTLIVNAIKQGTVKM